MAFDLRKWRKGHNLTQGKMAEMFLVSPDTIYRLESGIKSHHLHLVEFACLTYDQNITLFKKVIRKYK